MRQPYPVRPRNKYGAPDDVTTDHGWIHSNLQIFGSRLPEVAQAFKTDNPFNALNFKEDDVTQSIAKWDARPCKLDDSYLVSWESYLHPPTAFCEHLAQSFNLHVMMEHTLPNKPYMPRQYFNWNKPIPQHHLPKLPEGE